MRDAAYCRIKQVVAVEKKVRRRKADIVAAVELGIGNGRVESINNKIIADDWKDEEGKFVWETDKCPTVINVW